jgi:hypothetical protein
LNNTWSSQNKMRPYKYSLADDKSSLQELLSSCTNFHVPWVNNVAFSFTENVWSVLNVTLIFLLAATVLPVPKQACLLQVHELISFTEIAVVSRCWDWLQFQNKLTSSLSFLQAANAASIVTQKRTSRIKRSLMC